MIATCACIIDFELSKKDEQKIKEYAKQKNICELDALKDLHWTGDIIFSKISTKGGNTFDIENQDYNCDEIMYIDD